MKSGTERVPLAVESAQPGADMQTLRIVRAENDRLFDESGRSYIDLFSAHGTTWLGHANRQVGAEIAQQLEQVWICGGLGSPLVDQAKAMVDSWFPSSHGLCTLYSTGMEAAEFALRLARVVTGRCGVVGFERCMHGKSLATAYLGWDNRDGLELPFFHRLPFVPCQPEEQILARLEDVLAGGQVSAVFLEPLQGQGGHSASPSFYRQVSRLCTAKGTLLVFDEILSGFYRTGAPFFFSDLDLVPDIILIGKAMGNGFPVSGVVADKRFPLRREMLPGSTYASNPLAAAAVVATLRQFPSLDLAARVARIDQTICDGLGSMRTIGAALRGKGALWVLELPPGPSIEDIVVRIYQRGVTVSYTGRQIRVLPAATISLDNLARACSVVRDEVFRAYHD
jgi:acetylornithine/succinyldiaminopimelate/putrescine aminotransferase